MVPLWLGCDFNLFYCINGWILFSSVRLLDTNRKHLCSVQEGFWFLTFTKCFIVAFSKKSVWPLIGSKWKLKKIKHSPTWVQKLFEPENLRVCIADCEQFVFQDTCQIGDSCPYLLDRGTGIWIAHKSIEKNIATSLKGLLTPVEKFWFWALCDFNPWAKPGNCIIVTAELKYLLVSIHQN